MSPTSVNGGRSKHMNHHMQFLCNVNGADRPCYCIWVAVETLLGQRNGKQFCVCVAHQTTGPSCHTSGRISLTSTVPTVFLLWLAVGAGQGCKAA